jgi:ubiquinone/menaquinone biosynthesis C-methylase UbiE
MDAKSVWGISGNWAEIYHSCFVPTIIAPWVERTLALAAPRPGERLLDVACGTGAVTRQAARNVGPTGQVVGLDLSPEALAVARSLNGPEGSATIEWREGAADALPFADGSFDVVTCQLGLMFFPERVAALREMRRVLTQNGRLALMTWGARDRCPGQSAVVQIWVRHLGAEQADNWTTMHSLNDPAQVRMLLEDAGFAETDAQTQVGNVHFASPQELVCSYGALKGDVVDAPVYAALCEDADQLLKPYCSAEGLDYPIEAVLAWACRR